jgi:hypothetical protein
MTSTNTTTTTPAADATVTSITKAKRPSRASRAAAQNAKSPSTSKSATTKSTSASDKPTRVLDADAAKARAELLDERTKAAEGETGKKAIPAGYVLHWSYPAGHSRLSRTDAAPEGAAKWLARCDEHGTTKPADSAKSARALGSRARRVEWCKPCATAAKAKAAAAAKPSTAK